MRGAVTLAGMVEPCQVVSGDMPCADLEELVTGSHDAPSMVVRGADGAIGLVTRSAFMSRMAGRYGYGRSLWGRQPVSSLTTWSIPTVTEATSIVDAAALMVDDALHYRDLPVVNAAGEPVGVVRPVHVMRALAELTAQRAATDELTGVASRARFIDDLEFRLGSLELREGSALLLAFIDLDGLKPVNDLLGHSSGDALLRSVARRLAAGIGDGDHIGRLGGDEFAVLSAVTEADDVEAEARALELGESLRAALAVPDASLPAAASSRASIGVAVGRAGVTSHALLAVADEAMYAAKAAGGDRVRIGADASPTGPRVVPTAGLELAYQPVVDVRTGRVCAVEALVREVGAGGERIYPAARMDRAARSGNALAMDRWVLARACADMVAWASEAGDETPRRVHVNLAPSSLAAHDLADALLTVIDASGLPRERVCLELSELAGVEDLMAAAPQLAALASAGVALALDDMGATLGALRLLGSSLPIDCVKVDRSMVVGAALGRPFDAEMLALVVRLADLFALEVVAEGVETDAEAEAVRHAGVDRVQGFFHARPMPLAAVTTFVAAREAALGAPGRGDDAS